MNHQQFLQHALIMAEMYRGQTAPNPAVGALLVRNNQIIAGGAHKGAGCAHAEVAAIDSCEDTTDSILYVTLEPCSHQGKTGPCTDAIVAAGIREVYYAYTDPNSAVSGRGASVLEERGVVCEQIDIPEINEFYQSYAYWLEHNIPWVCAKIALTLDGKIAGAGGKARKISGAAADEYTHINRYRFDAILTTASTLNNDDPQLNARIDSKILAKKLYILDSTAKINQNLRIYDTAESITVFHGEHASQESLHRLEERGIHCQQIPSSASGLDLAAVLGAMAEDGCHDVWVEAGSRCFQSLMREKHLNKALIMISSKIFGVNALSAFDQEMDFGAESASWHVLGEDVMCEMTFER